jgi:hypothetical protein
VAFTPQEKARILFYLGYSMFEDDGPAQRAINALDSKEPVAGQIVRGLMDKIERISRDEEETRVLAKAIKSGSNEVRAHYTLDVLRSLGREHVNRLATFCKISICSDIFSSGGAARNPTDFFSGDPSEKRINPAQGMPTIGSFGPNPLKIR